MASSAMSFNLESYLTIGVPPSQIPADSQPTYFAQRGYQAWAAEEEKRVQRKVSLCIASLIEFWLTLYKIDLRINT